jgi:hypothetical protein
MLGADPFGPRYTIILGTAASAASPEG